jgi:hypothetical protein
LSHSAALCLSQLLLTRRRSLLLLAAPRGRSFRDLLVASGRCSISAGILLVGVVRVVLPHRPWDRLHLPRGWFEILQPPAAAPPALQSVPHGCKWFCGAEPFLLYSGHAALPCVHHTSALRRTPPHSAALRRTPPHSAALRSTPPHSAALRSTPLLSAALRRTPPHSAALRCSRPHWVSFCLQAVALSHSTALCLSQLLLTRRRSLSLLATLYSPRGRSFRNLLVASGRCSISAGRFPNTNRFPISSARYPDALSRALTRAPSRAPAGVDVLPAFAVFLMPSIE